jgi:stage III sporulation protein AE
LQQNGALLEHCRTAIWHLDTFSKVLFGVFAAASAAAGRPASAVATAGAAMLFSQLIITLSRQVFLPAVTLYLLLIYGGILSENGALHQAAAMGKWGINTFFKVFLTAYFTYLSFTGLVTGTADAAAVRTAQSLSSTVPLVGSVISGASETILAGASLLRAGVGFVGFLGAAAICLAPFLQGVCHMLVFRVLSVFAASFAEGGCKTMLDALSQAYSMLIGILTACCAVQFITIVVSMTVTGT